MGGGKQQIAVYDEARLVGEREAYQNWLDRRAERSTASLLQPRPKALTLRMKSRFRAPLT